MPINGNLYFKMEKTEKYRRDEFLNQLENVLLELKKLKEIKRIAGDMDLLDELRMINEFLIASCYNWGIIVASVMDMAKFYRRCPDVPDAEKENVLENVSTFIKVAVELNKFHCYVGSTQIFCEEVLTELDNKQ